MPAEQLPSLAGPPKYQRTRSQPENPFFPLIHGQEIAIVPSFTLESGVVLANVPVAFKTWGQLNDTGDNVMVICHALSGSADVADWWGPLIGGGKAFDTSRFFIVCLNALGSPYGSASPVTMDSLTEQYYGPEFPLTTVRDDVNIHKLVLDDLGVEQVAVVIGGSMGGMNVLEWAYLGKDYVRAIVPMATSSRHSAWCISWAEAQRQSIACDPKYDDGYYPFDDPPIAGLGAARMSALLTYRSRNSFESRFGRNTPDPSRHKYLNMGPRRTPITPGEQHWAIHTDGFRNVKKLSSTAPSPPSSDDANGAVTPSQATDSAQRVPAPAPAPATTRNGSGKPSTHFSAQTYLRYQGDKFVKRFDANCYIAITRKLDTHDVSRGRVASGNVREALQLIQQPALVIGIESDGLFTYAEQQEIAECIPNARLATIDSPEGHDAFLLEFDDVNRHILDFLQEVLPDIMGKPGVELKSILEEAEVEKVQKGTVGEVDDITAW